LKTNLAFAGLPNDLVHDNDERWGRIKSTAGDIFASGRYDIKEKVHAFFSDQCHRLTTSQLKISFGSSSNDTVPPPAAASDTADDNTSGEGSANPVRDPRHEGAMSLFELCKTIAKIRHDLNITVTPEFAGRVALLVCVSLFFPSTSLLTLFSLQRSFLFHGNGDNRFWMDVDKQLSAMRNRFKDDPAKLAEYVSAFYRCTYVSFWIRTMNTIIQVDKANFGSLSATVFEYEQASPEQGRINSVVRQERELL
jgi:hypothetical protein